jgi:hypothetical protein
LKKFALHFFNYAVGVTGENKAANPVTGKLSNQLFNDCNSFVLPLIEGISLCKLQAFDILLQFLEGFFIFILIKTSIE